MKHLGILVVTMSLVGLPLTGALADQRGQQAGQQQQPQDRQQAALVDVTTILGAQVRDKQGQDLGSIDRLLADPQDGSLRYAVVATGGFLGIGRDHVQVPWDDLQVQRDRQQVVVTMDRQALEQAPAAEARARNDAPAASPRMTPGTATQPAQQQQYTQQQQPAQQQQQRQAAQPAAEGLVDVNSILGAQVRDPQGQDMGRIDRLMADPKDGRLRYAVVATGGFLGIGRDHVQVPWDSVRVQRDQQDVVVTMDRQILQQAPTAERTDRTPAASPRTAPGTQPGQQQPQRQQEHQAPRQ